MFLLAIGLILWVFPHLSKMLAPKFRARMDEKRGRMAIALVTVVSLILIIAGYRIAPVIVVWSPPAFLQHLNNLLMVFAVLLFVAAHSKSRLRTKIRHPMLLGTAIWGFAHLLVNGDLASVILFGFMLVWALVTMQVTNARRGHQTPFAGGTLKGDIRLGLITLVTFVVIVLIHTALGYPPVPMG
ncbi:NnrU protein [Aquimixticola soesokkakensis]|uniref:NnrU protein n=1 Tax=Aquimixticola soesokkakensis TaxID=1519096 RepID=A0A1Y5TDC0_9RHOB|nr:NnrU family protein [Aquimixticola soesokkakensis]SLN61138.1 NnrU protein [Aquimixticola soesokkakensis]